MQNIMICRDNINLIMDLKKDRNEIDQEFLDALWQYVLYSRNTSRTAPKCRLCSKQGDFKFNVLGGIKNVGNGLMYIPVNKDELYIIPDVVFHYYYIHNIAPIIKFRNAVVGGVKPDSIQYVDMVKSSYVPKEESVVLWRHIKCDCCGNSFNGCIAFRNEKKTQNVKVYQERKFNKIFYKDNYVGVCYKCLHYTKV